MSVAAELSGPVWRTSRRVIDLSRPRVMGILNVTPDSFSDGDRYFDAARAVDRALEMAAEGADIIDIGGESTRPYAPPVDQNEELRRVVPVVEKLAGCLNIPLAVDTYKAAVAREALQAGAEIINDISALALDPDMASVIAAAGAGAVLMHMRGTPQNMQVDTAYTALIEEIAADLGKSMQVAEAAGIGREQIVLDPGIGFGKSIEGNLEILRRLREFAKLGRPLLIGTSRKSFIGKLLGRDMDHRQFGTAATVVIAIMHGASIVRVHDVKEMRDVVDMTTAVCGGGPR